MRKLAHLALALFLAFLSAVPASAHYLWIERDQTEDARLFFGEFQEDLREVTGGRLDAIAGPQAWSVDATGKSIDLKATRQANHFLLQAAPKGADVLAQETGIEVRDFTKQGRGIVKPMLYARYGTGSDPARPALTLDIVRDGGAPSTFTVYFRKQPLAKTKVMVYAANGWGQQLQTDASGAVKISTPWPGPYVVQVRHTEKQPGEFRDQKFESIIHSATLSLTVTEPSR